MPSSPVSCAQVDDSWRAHALSCRGGFDFTLLFEEVILGVLPIGIILILTPFRLWHLARKPHKVVGSGLLLTKLVCPCLRRRLHLANFLFLFTYSLHGLRLELPTWS